MISSALSFPSLYRDPLVAANTADSAFDAQLPRSGAEAGMGRGSLLRRGSRIRNSGQADGAARSGSHELGAEREPVVMPVAENQRLM